MVKDRSSALNALVPANVLAYYPLIAQDKQFDQAVVAPRIGFAYDAGKWGVFRGTYGKYHEWLSL